MMLTLVGTISILPVIILFIMAVVLPGTLPSGLRVRV